MGLGTRGREPVCPGERDLRDGSARVQCDSCHCRPGNVLGSTGVRNEVRPEAPNHWARRRTRNCSALLQSGPGPGEMVTLGTSLATLKTVGNEEGKCLSCRKRSQWSEGEVGSGRVASELTGGVPSGSGETEQGLSTENPQQVEWEVEQFSF